MKTKKLLIGAMFLFLIGFALPSQGQTLDDDLDGVVDEDPYTVASYGFDPTLLSIKDVVENGIYQYTVTGDDQLTGSTFVFKVVGGTLVTSLTDEAPITVASTNGTGTHSVAEAADGTATIFVKWDNPVFAPSVNFVAVYEVSSSGCINKQSFETLFKGYQFTITPPPAVWFAGTANSTDYCSEDGDVPAEVIIGGTDADSPWDMTYTIDGGATQTRVITAEEITAGKFDLSIGTGFVEINPTGVDHIITILSVTSSRLAQGTVAPDGMPTQSATYTYKVHRLPVTVGMDQN